MGEGRLSLGPLQTTECRFFWPQDLITPVQQTLLAVLLQGQERVRLVGGGSLQPGGFPGEGWGVCHGCRFWASTRRERERQLELALEGIRDKGGDGGLLGLSFLLILSQPY